MYCPTCGIETLNNKRFCRGCGMDLQLIFQALAGQPAQSTQNTAVESPRKKARRLGFTGMAGGLILAMLFSILGGAFSNLDEDLGRFISTLGNLGGMVFTIGLGFLIYSYFLSKTSAASNNLQQDAALPTNPQLHMPSPEFRIPQFEYRQKVSSVTENTTELLDRDDTADHLHR